MSLINSYILLWFAGSRAYLGQLGCGFPLWPPSDCYSSFSSLYQISEGGFLQKTERVLMRESTRCLRCSLFRGRYSNNKHFRTVLSRSLSRAPKSMAKHPETSRPSRFGWYSKMAFRVSPVKRLQNLKLIFLSWFGMALTIYIAVASSICLQYDRSSF